MTLRDACLQALTALDSPMTSGQVLEIINQKRLFDFGTSKYPLNTVSATLGNFLRAGDSRIDRIANPDGSFSYFLTKTVSIDDLSKAEDILHVDPTLSVGKNYLERSLHKLLSTFLSAKGVVTRTIYHEQSNGKDSSQTWVHPDMVGIQFLEMKSSPAQNFVQTVNKKGTFTLLSYELKREIHSDAALKQAYFQAVSNSSWANQGYLVAFEFSNSLSDEMRRLNQSFGIGIIKLSPYPFESEVLYPAVFRDIDYRTVDKLCHLNSKFGEWIEDIDRFLSVDERNKRTVKAEFEHKSDSILETDEQVEAYCDTNYIPIIKKKSEILD